MLKLPTLLPRTKAQVDVLGGCVGEGLVKENIAADLCAKKQVAGRSIPETIRELPTVQGPVLFVVAPRPGVIEGADLAGEDVSLWCESEVPGGLCRG